MKKLVGDMAPKGFLLKRPAATATEKEPVSRRRRTPVASEETLLATPMPGGGTDEDSYPCIQEASSGDTSCGKCGEPIILGAGGAVKVGAGNSYRCGKCNALLVRMWRRGLDVKRLDGMTADAKREFFSKGRETAGKIA